jgi:hypothetical protein
VTADPVDGRRIASTKSLLGPGGPGPSGRDVGKQYYALLFRTRLFSAARQCGLVTSQRVSYFESDQDSHGPVSLRLSACGLRASDRALAVTVTAAES